MTRAWLVVFVAVVSAVLRTSTPSAQVPVFRAGAQTVPVYATVLDVQGRLVPGLTKRDFQIFDNGEPVEITTFSNDIMPVSLVLLLDMSASMAGEHPRVQQAALKFVDALLPEDRVRVGTFGDEIALSAWLTSDKDVLRRVLREEVWPGGGTPLWSAMRAAMKSLDEVTGRRALLVLSDGIDTGCPTLIGSFAPTPEFEFQGPEFQGSGFQSSGFRGANSQRGARNSERFPSVPLAISRGQRTAGLFPGATADPRCSSLLAVEKSAADGEFMTYAVGMEGPGMTGGLERLPDQTGGGHFELKRNADLATTFAQVADELHHQYALGFSPARLDGQTHRLELRLTNRALVARARKSYLASEVAVGESPAGAAGTRTDRPSASPVPVPAIISRPGAAPAPVPNLAGQVDAASGSRDATILLLDTSASVSRSAMLLDPRFAEVFNAFLRGLAPGDRSAVGVVANQTRFTKLTSDTRELTMGVRALLRVADAERLGPSPIWDALDNSLTMLEGQGGRQAIALFSDGKASGNLHGSADVLARAKRLGVAIYAVIEGGGTRLIMQPMAGLDPADVVRQVAEGSGGLLWLDRPANPRERNPAASMAQIMEAIRAR